MKTSARWLWSSRSAGHEHVHKPQLMQPQALLANNAKRLLAHVDGPVRRDSHSCRVTLPAPIWTSALSFNTRGRRSSYTAKRCLVSPRFPSSPPFTCLIYFALFSLLLAAPGRGRERGFWAFREMAWRKTTWVPGYIHRCRFSTVNVHAMAPHSITQY